MRILVIDGNSILNRAFYGIKVLTTSRGFYTNAITGFMNIYLKEQELLKPDATAVAFDLKAPTFRHKQCAFYKANRHGMPQELAMQLPKVKELLTDLGVPILELEGYEADDILGSVSKLFADGGNECYLLSGDRDNLQLIGDNITVRLATNRETISFDRDRFFAEYGVEPINLIDIKALMGDSSDNIPGVPGIGEKTALTLIREYCTVENLYSHLEEAKLTPSVKTKLTNGHESAMTSKWLATILRDAPVSHNFDDYKPRGINSEAAAKLLSELEMFRLIDKLGLSKVEIQPDAPEEVNDDYTLAEPTAEEISGLQTESEFILNGDSLTVKSGDKLFTLTDKSLILDYFCSPSPKTTFEAKSAYKLCFESNRELNNLAFSCDLAGYLLNSQSSEYTISNLCSAYNVPYSSDPNFADILSLKRLANTLKDELEKTGMESLYKDIELPLCEVLASMEVYGVRVDTNGIREFGENLDGDIERIRDEIYTLAGHEFNISSPKQLGVVLFEELSLPSGKKTKSGYSTNAEILEGLANHHPIINLILEYRTLTKLKSTYVDGLLDVVHPDGRVRSEFKQTETRTGRISSANPNMQNIPVRKELGREMRRFFIAREGAYLLDADYSQIELRVLAAMCKDENMTATFLSGTDIHTRTASQVFGVPEDFVDPDMRRAAKAVNFGIVYGIGAFSLSKDINVSVAEADRYIKSYLANFPGVDKFMRETVDFAVKNGYVTTLFGRRRYIPELKNSNKNLQAFGKRAAMNAPVQGTAADIIKIAMVKVYRRLKEEKLNARLILQVHDELIVEADKDCAQRAAEILETEMKNAVSLTVPLIAEVNTGASWYDAKL
jgi:DNA polymerase-1